MNAFSGNRSGATSLALLSLLLLAAPPIPAHAAPPKPDWLSPLSIVGSTDNARLYIACESAHQVLAMDPATRQIAQRIAMAARPTGLALSPDGTTLAVTCASPSSEVCLIDVPKGRIRARLRAGHSSIAPVFSPDGTKLYACNSFNDDVSEFNLATGKEVRRIKVQRQPVAAAITHDGRHLLVANLIQNGSADGPQVAAVVSVIDTSSGRVVKELTLPNGSGSLNDLRISPDGKYAVVTHILGRFYLPTTQLDRGWMNTNAGTLIDLDRMEILNTVLLDSVDRGAANPWGLAWSTDGSALVVAHAGSHELSVIDFPALLAKLAAIAKPAPQGAAAPPAYRASASRTPADVPNDLSFLVGIRERVRLPENDLGPRGITVLGKTVYAAGYFSDTLSVLPLDAKPMAAQSVALGARPEMTAERRGELNFNDARLCFQNWQSCASCHPGDARIDGLNWDLLNDGVGNPKNNKSLLYVHRTPPSMSIGVRENAEAAVRAGIKHILFTVQSGSIASDMDAYLKSLRPVPSPHLVKGKLSAAAKRGEKLFRSNATGCAQCHPGPLFTDLKQYEVGTAGPLDKKGEAFDTPTLVEIWRTAPYLHDGSAATLQEVLTSRNSAQQHGRTSQLTPAQIDDVVEYLLSL